MKTLRSRKFAIAFACVFLISIHATYAIGFGTETTTSTQACGDCVCTYTTSTFYLFWIPISSSTLLTSLDCSGIGIQ